MSLPQPPADIDDRSPRLVTIVAGASLHRFYTSVHDPVFYDRSDQGRLNAPDGSYGVLYAAERSRGAFAETFLRTPGRRMIDPGLWTRKAHATLDVVRDLTLVAFDGPGLAILGATAEVIHGSPPYGCSQAWSAALHSHPTGVDGIAYSARHDPHETCYALFDRAAMDIRENERILDLDADWFWELAEVYAVARSP